MDTVLVMSFWEEATPILLIWLVFYLLVIRPDRARRGARIREAVRTVPGDRVVLMDGFEGTVLDARLFVDETGLWRREFDVAVSLDGIQFVMTVLGDGVVRNMKPADEVVSFLESVRRNARRTRKKGAAERAAADTMGRRTRVSQNTAANI